MSSIASLRSALLRGAACVAFVGWGPAAAAAEAAPSSEAGVSAAASDNSVQEVVVTALRHESRLQTTPAAIVAVTGEELKRKGIETIQDLALTVPGLLFGDTGGQAHIAIRGIGSDVANTGNDPRVAFYQDGVYIARMSAQLAGMFDIDRIEILKGPQGTLYGRNAMGGALIVISRTPTADPSGYATLAYGNHNEIDVNAALSGPLGKTLSARLAVHEQRHDGYGKNLVTGHDVDNRQEEGARLSLRWAPTDSLSALTIADYSHEADNANGVHYIGPGNPNVTVTGLRLGGFAAPNSRDIASAIDPKTHNTIWGINETIDYRMDAVSIKSTTAYRDSRTSLLTNVDGTSLALVYLNPHEHARQWSEELNFSGSFGQLDWLVGGLYFHESATDATVAPFSAALFGGPLTYRQGYFTGGELRTNAYAPYVGLTYHVTDKLTITAGGRYNAERKSIRDQSQLDFSRAYAPTNPILNLPGFPRSAYATFRGFVPSATVDYKFSPNVFSYVTYSQGFKSGGFNIGVNQPAFRPEKLTNYELGVKTSWPEQRLTANLTAFHQVYKNLQVSQIQGTAILIENAAAATINGAELETKLGPVDGFSVDASVAYLDATYDRFSSIDSLFVAAGPRNLAGNHLTQAPKVSASAGVQKVWQTSKGRVTARADVNYVSKVYFTPFNDAATSQRAHTIVSASLGYRSDAGWSLEGYVKNIGNVKTLGQSYPSNPLVGLPILGLFNPPRTFGVRLGYEF